MWWWRTIALQLFHMVANLPLLAGFPDFVKIVNRRQRHRQYNSTNNESSPSLWINLTLCQEKCRDNCQSYVSPSGACFSSASWFPNDPSWSDGWDILDVLHNNSANPKEPMLHRSIYPTKNGTCLGEDPDSFEIPLNQCVGPFGAPRPWGTFQLISPDTATEMAMNKAAA